MPVIALLVCLTACGVQPDSGPREVPEDNQAQLTGASSGGVASGADRIYLVGPGDDRLLRSVSRDAASPDDLIATLLRGPNETETNDQYASVIPPTLQLLATGGRARCSPSTSPRS